MKRKFLAWMLTVAMVITLFPVSAVAVTPPDADIFDLQFSEEGTISSKSNSLGTPVLTASGSGTVGEVEVEHLGKTYVTTGYTKSAASDYYKIGLADNRDAVVSAMEDGFTMELAFTLPESAGAEVGLMNAATGGGTGITYEKYSGQLSFCFHDGGYKYTSTLAERELTVGELYVMTCVYEAENGKIVLYINGEYESELEINAFHAGNFFATWFLGASPNGTSGNAKANCNPCTFTMARVYSDVLTEEQAADSYEAYIETLTEKEEEEADPAADIFDIVFGEDGTMTSASESLGAPTITASGSGTVGEVEVEHLGKTYVTTGYTKSAQADYVDIDLKAYESAVDAALKDGFTLEAAFTLPESVSTEVGILNGAGGGAGMGITYEKAAGMLSFCFHDGGYKYVYSDADLTVGELYVLTCTFEDTNNIATLYINGEYVSELAVGEFNAGNSLWRMGKSPTGAVGCGVNTVTMARLYSDVLTEEQAADSYEAYIDTLTEVEKEAEPVDSGTGDIFDLRFGKDGTITSASNMFGDPVISGTGGTVGEVAVLHNGETYTTTGFDRGSSDYRVVSLAANEAAIVEAIRDGFTLETAFTLPASTGTESGILNGAVAGGGMGINYEKETSGGGGGNKSVSFTFHDGSYRYTNTPALTEGELYVITCVYKAESDETQIYVNGELAATKAVADFNHGGFFATWFMGASPSKTDNASEAKAFAQENIFTMARLYSDVMTAEEVAASYEDYIGSLTKVEDVTADIFDLSFNADGTITSNVNTYGTATVSGTGGTVGIVVVPHNGKYYETTGLDRSSDDYRVVDMAAYEAAVVEAIRDGFTLETAFTLPASIGTESGILNGAVAGGGMGINYEKETSGGGGGNKSVSFTFHDGSYRYTNTPALTEGELYVITCVYEGDDSEAKIYVNGELAATRTVGGFNQGGFFATWYMGASPNATDNPANAKALCADNIFTMARLYSEPMVSAQVAGSYEAYIATLTETVPDSELESVEAVDPEGGIVELTFTYPIRIADPASVTLDGVAATGIEYMDAQTGADGQSYSTTLRVTFPNALPMGSALVIADAAGAVVDGKLDASVAAGMEENQLKANGTVSGADVVTATVTYVIPSTTTLDKAEKVDDTTVRLTFSDPVEILEEEGFFVANDFDETILYSTPGEVVNVVDYGAIPDDDVDDIYALQAAVDAVADGGVVYFPAGDYLLTKALVFYSNQTLYFEPGATLKRGSSTLTYLLGNRTYGTSDEAGYGATENVNIIGATFDGNEDINYKITMMNTGHCRNLNLINCTFRNGDTWHYYECNSSENILIDGCVFENSFTGSEQIQFDLAASGVYGIIQSVFGAEQFYFDNTVCQNITVRNCTFDNSVYGAVGIGNHTNGAHHDIEIYDNTFIGKTSSTRGAVDTVPGTYNLTFANNTFIGCAVAINMQHSQQNSVAYTSNVYNNVTTELQGGVKEVEGEGPTTPEAQAKYTFATSVEQESDTTVLVTFDSLENAAGAAVLLGAVIAEDGTLVIPNVFSGNAYVGSMADWRGITDFERLKAAIEAAEGTAEEPVVINVSRMIQQPEKLVVGAGQHVKLVGVGTAGLTRMDSCAGLMIEVQNGGSLTLENFVMDGGAIWADGAGSTNSGISVSTAMVNVAKGATLNMLDGTVLRNNANMSSHGGAVSVSGTFNMDGGTITANSAGKANGGNGGGVYIKGADGGAFNMSGGTISDNYSGHQGGAVYEHNNGNMTMSGGIITNNAALNETGGVRINNGKFTLSGGEISNNVSWKKGGGVYMNNGSVFVMTSGLITGNTVTIAETGSGYGGGGLYMNNASGSSTITGGEISGNTAVDGGGVYAYQGTLNVGGSAKITGNTATNGTANVAFGSNSKFWLTEAFAEGASVGFTPKEWSDGAVLATATYGDLTGAVLTCLTLDQTNDLFDLAVSGSTVILADTTTGCVCEDGFTKGNGTEDSPYRVSIAEELAHIAEHPDAYFILVGDIDATGLNLPLDVSFNGNLNGDFHTVTGITKAEDLFSMTDTAVVTGLRFAVADSTPATTLDKAEKVNDTTVRLTFSSPVEILSANNILVTNTLDANVLYETPGVFVDVTDYGATPDDDTDDIWSLQAAVDAAKGGGVVYFPAGTYMVTKALVFYSNQTLYFEPGATLKRGASDLTYLLGNHTDGTEGGYDATENVNIIGCTFDGNADIDYKITMMNTGHCRNINVINCTFRNGYQWHYFECNSTDTILIDGCVFEDSYDWNNNSGAEYLQFDAADSGAYGILVSVFGNEAFKFDGTVCKNVTVRNCVFDSTESRCVAIGNHNNKAHNTMSFYDNVFKGGMDYSNRGIINFTSSVYGLTFARNTFSDSPVGITCNNTDYTIYSSNSFSNVTTKWTGDITAIAGEGPVPATASAWYKRATAVEAESETTLLVTFDTLLGAEYVVVDGQGNHLVPDFCATGEVIGAATELEGNELDTSAVVTSGTTLKSAEQVNDTTVRLTFSDAMSALVANKIFVASNLDDTVLYPTPGGLVNVADFGADGSDNVDDTYALQAAIEAVKDGGTVYFPAGTYLLEKCLVFYSNQTLYFEEGAVLKRNSETLTYLLANRTYGDETGYSATKNVNIIGATFDGNEDIAYKITMLNTGHAENINVINCTFRNCYQWHCYECNSSKNVLIDGCVFEDNYRGVNAYDYPAWGYVDFNASEYIQLDYAHTGVYGIIESVYGMEDFCFDDTTCQDVVIRNCSFDATSSNAIAIGNHSPVPASNPHKGLQIYDNTFIAGWRSRGMINFVSDIVDVEIANNVFQDCEVAIGINSSVQFSQTGYGKVCNVYSSNEFINVGQPIITDFSIELVDGEGPTTPAAEATYSFATAVKQENDTTFLVTFDSLVGAKSVGVVLGGAVDANEALLVPNTYCDTAYVSAAVTLKTLEEDQEDDDKGSVIRPGTDVETPNESDDTDFVDVVDGSYYADAVDWAVANGITNGMTATIFAPNATCTRGQTVTFLWRAAGSPAPKSTEMPFADVVQGSYCYDAVLWAVENGITKGTTETTFSPNATVTRGQVVTFLYRWVGEPDSASANPFADVAEGSFCCDAVVWAVENGITKGVTATAFQPNTGCTRGQIVTFLYRYLG